MECHGQRLVALGLMCLAPMALSGCSGDRAAASKGAYVAQPAGTQPATTVTTATSTQASAGGAERAMTPAAAAAPKPAEPEWTIKRVGGKMDAVIEKRDESYFFGKCRITTPLPVGYPDPTPPGAVDLKKYPSIRRAEYTGATNADLGMNLGFFPLFNHIKRRNIEMTSPVEMDFTPATKEEAERSEGGTWTMSFLYRKPEQGDTGLDAKDKNVKIVDTAPMTVVAFGVMGG